MFLGEQGRNELYKRIPHFDLVVTRYSRVLDAVEREFKKEGNEIYKIFQLLLQKKNESAKHWTISLLLSGLMATFNFGALETRILMDVFTVIVTNRGAQNELCRSTKTPEEVYRMVLSYERGNNYAKTSIAVEGAPASGPTCGELQVGTESLGKIRGG